MGAWGLHAEHVLLVLGAAVGSGRGPEFIAGARVIHYDTAVECLAVIEDEG